MVGISEALAIVGDENIRLQNIRSCALHSKDNDVAGDTDITFRTDQINSTDLVSGNGKVGIIVWVDKDAMDKAIEEVNNAKPK